MSKLEIGVSESCFSTSNNSSRHYYWPDELKIPYTVILKIMWQLGFFYGKRTSTLSKFEKIVNEEHQDPQC